jgi:putative FmdB family regulatory protein
MPAYNYKCTECNELIEVRHGMNESYSDACEKCGNAMRKLISAGAGVIFKGSGFYCSDFKNNGSKPAEGKAGCAGCPNADK